MYNPYHSIVDPNNSERKCHCPCHRVNYLLWSKIPYPNQDKPYVGIEPLCGSWKTNYIFIAPSNIVYTLNKKPIFCTIKNPNKVNFQEELKEVEYVQANLTEKEKNIATFWGTGVPLQQWMPICLKLISAYNVNPPRSARIINCLTAAINDAFVLTWHFKYLYNCARPCQLNRELKPFLSTPQFPTYISGHSVVSATAATVLSYFFPRESEKLETLANTASISRLFGGIHFRSDLEEGLKIGRELGFLCVSYMKRNFDSKGNPLDIPFIEFKDADIMPNYDN